MGLGRGKGNEEISVQLIGRRGSTVIETFSNLFLKKVAEGAVTTEAGSIFQYYTSLTENGNPCMTISLRKLLPLLLV